MNITLPQLPNLPSPPNVSFDLNFDLKINGFSLPDLPVLPNPPALPELPSFIPKVDFKLPTLPPAPSIPPLVSELKGILDGADKIGKIYCMLKQGIGLVAEK